MAVSLLGYSGLFRVRLDLSGINTAASVTKPFWILVDPLKHRTIADLREVIRIRSKLPDDQAIELYVQDALLPDEESILLLREGDDVKVVPGFRPLPCMLQAASDVVSASENLIELDDSVDELGLKRKSHPLCKKEKRKRKKEAEPEELRSIEKIRNHIKDAHYSTKLGSSHVSEPGIRETDKQKHGQPQLAEPINQEQGNTREWWQKLDAVPPANVNQACHEATDVIEEPPTSDICEVNEVVPIPFTTGVPKRKRNRRKKHRREPAAIDGGISFGNGDNVLPQTCAVSELFMTDASKWVKNKHIIFEQDNDILMPESETVATPTTNTPQQQNLFGADNAVTSDLVTSVANRLKQAENHSGSLTSVLPHSSFVEGSKIISAEVLSDGNVTANKSLNGPFKQLSKSQQINSTSQNISTIYTNIDSVENSSVKGKYELLGKQVAEKGCDSWIPFMGPPQLLTPDACKQNSEGRELVEAQPVSSNHEKLRLAPEDYIKYPILKGPPRVGDIIAYKVLELSPSYCPEESEYKEGKVVKCDPVSDVVDIELFFEADIKPRSGKFELAYADYGYSARNNNVSVPWSSMIEPRLLSA